MCVCVCVCVSVGGGGGLCPVNQNSLFQSPGLGISATTHVLFLLQEHVWMRLMMAADQTKPF